jgi:hypothetical protein
MYVLNICSLLLVGGVFALDFQTSVISLLFSNENEIRSGRDGKNSFSCSINFKLSSNQVVKKNAQKKYSLKSWTFQRLHGKKINRKKNQLLETSKREKKSTARKMGKNWELIAKSRKEK